MPLPPVHPRLGRQDKTICNVKGLYRCFFRAPTVAGGHHPRPPRLPVTTLLINVCPPSRPSRTHRSSPRRVKGTTLVGGPRPTPPPPSPQGDAQRTSRHAFPLLIPASLCPSMLAVP